MVKKDVHAGDFLGVEGAIFKIKTGEPTIAVSAVTISGPLAASGASDTPSRQRLLVCQPRMAAEETCARQITSALARRAFRRPVSQADLDRLMPFYEQGRAGAGGFDEGVELMVTAVLASPDFLYRSIAPRGAAGADAYALDDSELASRLSFFLWSSIPDDQLLDLAAAGKLKDAGMKVNEADRNAFRVASKPIYQDFSAEVPGGKEMIDKTIALGSAK